MHQTDAHAAPIDVDRPYLILLLETGAGQRSLIGFGDLSADNALQRSSLQRSRADGSPKPKPQEGETMTTITIRGLDRETTERLMTVADDDDWASFDDRSERRYALRTRRSSR